MNQHTEIHNKFFNASCVDAKKGMLSLPAQSVDLILCDLPFGITRNQWDTVIPYDQLWEAYNHVIKPNGAILLFASQPFDKVLAYSNIKDYKYDWIWEKNKATGHLNAKIAPMRAHENILVFYKQTPEYYPQATPEEGSFDGYTYTGHKPMNKVNARKLSQEELDAPLRNYGHAHCSGNEGGSTKRLPRSVLRFPVVNNDSSEKWHPTQKPTELLQYLIKTYTKEGDLVLDNCMGSGATAIAALATDRKYVGYELDRDYYKMAAKRIKAFEQDMAVCP